MLELCSFLFFLLYLFTIERLPWLSAETELYSGIEIKRLWGFWGLDYFAAQYGPEPVKTKEQNVWFKWHESHKL